MHPEAETHGLAVDAPRTAARQAALPRKPHHYPALDGLRGAAVLSVVCAHYIPLVVPASRFGWAGWLGVDVFFVLSGFLITGILFDSLGQPHFFRTFYTRRTLRIFPLYYSVWIFFFVLTPWLHPLWTRFDIARVFYYGNLMDFQHLHHLEIAANDFKFFSPRGRLTGFNTGHLWSLCLEEQFYLVWPLLVFWLRDRRRIMHACVIGAAAFLVSDIACTRWALQHHVDTLFIYDATFTHAGPLLFGAWVALWQRGPNAPRAVRPAVSIALIIIPLSVLILALHTIGRQWEGREHNPVVTSFGYTCSALFGCGLLLATIQQEGLIKRIFALRWLRLLGVVSYGMYVFQGYLLGFFQQHLDVFQRRGLGLLMPPTAFAASLALSLISYHLLEKPFLRLKDRFAPSVPVAITGRDPLAPI